MTGKRSRTPMPVSASRTSLPLAPETTASLACRASRRTSATAPGSARWPVLAMSASFSATAASMSSRIETVSAWLRASIL